MRLGCRQLVEAEPRVRPCFSLSLTHKVKLKGENLEMASGPGSTFPVGRKADVTVMWEVAQPVSGKGKIRSWLFLLGCAKSRSRPAAFHVSEKCVL